MEKNVILTTNQITKSFFGNIVLENIDFDLRAGEIHTILGENGAGKSTFLKILSGVYAKDCGQIKLQGKPVEITNILDAQKHGISMIFQELNVLNNLKVYENIFLGREFKKFGLLDEKKTILEARKLLDRLRVSIDPLESVENLKISDKQMVEIAKSLSCDAKIIIMDEPTSSLSEREIETLFALVKQLKEESNISFIFISHRLKEVQEISDRITIFRDGKKISTIDLIEEPYDEKEIVKQMVGRDIGSYYVIHKNVENESIDKEELIRVSNLCSEGEFNNVNLSIREGEILGIAGLVGAGRSELVSSLVGLHPYSGDIQYFGESCKLHSPYDAMKLGIGYVPEDRKELGLIVNMNVRENSTLSLLRQISHLQVINKQKETKIANDSIAKFGVKTQGSEVKLKYLSGGNQQKIALARSLNTEPRIVLLDEPTRGVDVNAKREIYMIISKLVENGISVVMVSSELPEIFGISDRILVMFEGEVTGKFQNLPENHEKVMNALLGVINYEK